MMFSFHSSFAVVRRSFVCRSLATKAIERPFRILGVQQIAIGSEKSEPLTNLWRDIFGLEKHSSHRIESENVEEDIIKLGPAPYEVEIDLMRPIDPNASPKVWYN
jgi:lactoylglutathione lyase